MLRTCWTAAAPALKRVTRHLAAARTRQDPYKLERTLDQDAHVARYH
jgi:hypothetical protein